MTKDSQPENLCSKPDYSALVGIDWGDKTHHLQIYDCVAQQVVEHLTLDSSPEDVHHWIQALGQRFGHGRIAVGLEANRGALLYVLAAYDFVDIYLINPVTSGRYRKAFTPSGAKDDMPDAGLCLKLILLHRDEIGLWQPACPQDQIICHLSEKRRKLVGQQVDVRNQLICELKSYFPQALELAGEDLASSMACKFLLKWGDPASLKRARLDTVRRFYYAHGCRRGDVIEKRLEMIREMRAVTDDESIIQPARIYVKALAQQLLQVGLAVSDFDKHIELAFGEHPDAEIWASFPGAGKTLAPRLAAAWGSNRNRYLTVKDIQVFSGIAPVRERSGKSDWVHRRYQRPKFIHQSFWEHAKCSVAYCAWASAYVKDAQARGMKYSAAIRSLAFKWQRIMFACWKNHTTYDDEYYTNRLKTSGAKYLLTDSIA